MRFIPNFFLSLHREIMKTMKKAFLILILFPFFSGLACTGNGNEKEPGAATDVQKETSQGNVAYLTTEQFRQFVWDYKANPNTWVYKGDVPCMIDFYADWCRPCKMVAPIMEDMAKQYKGKIRIYKVNTDQERELSGVFKISSIPAVLFIPKSGEPQMSVGALPKETFEKAIHDVFNIK